jgi:hypothetical protein
LISLNATLIGGLDHLSQLDPDPAHVVAARERIQVAHHVLHPRGALARSGRATSEA